MKLDRSTVFACIVCAALGAWATSGGHDDSWPGPGPGPRPRPLDDRPVLKWVARIAKTVLWVSLFTEDPSHQDRVELAHARVGDDGEPMLDHGRGW